MFPRLMRFFEYEARELVKRAGIPVTDYGFATTPQEARELAVRRALRPDDLLEAGVLRRRRVGLDSQAAQKAVQRHGRHRHRGGRREPPRPRRPRALLEHPAAQR